jgi:hypothetical protein
MTHFNKFASILMPCHHFSPSCTIQTLHAHIIDVQCSIHTTKVHSINIDKLDMKLTKLY